MLLILLSSFLSFLPKITASPGLQWNTSDTYQGVLYKQPPFYQLDDYGNPAGIIPVLFELGRVKCTPNATHILLHTKIVLESRLKSFDVMRNTSIRHGEGILKNLTTPQKVMWGPFDYYLAAVNVSMFHERGLETFDILKSQEVVVIMSRSEIWLPNKLLRGIINSNIIVFAVSLLSFISGLLFWIFELPFNSNCKPKTGAGSGIYWAFVTMTTVGYGDVTPITFLGRSLAVMWMLLGLAISSILTATISDTVSGINGLEISGKTVSVLSRSHQEYQAQVHFGVKDYISYETYEEVVEAVRQEKVFAALLPIEIAAWMKDQILDETESNVLSMVYTLPGVTIFNMLLSKDAFPFAKDMLDCMFGTLRQSVLETAQDYFRQPINLQTNYYGGHTIGEIFKSPHTLKMIAVIGILAIIGAIWAYWNFRHQKSKIDKGSEARELDGKIDKSIKELSNMIDKLNQIKNGNGFNPITRKEPLDIPNNGFVY
ncbi:uncharacterized protein [Clytia hemisphaerica]|uniref:uncharacterized protein n=1 Tax=Clytia hemisphaerica TaxID=252671 RepID=UPI0034D5773A